ncbi:hypothetical protein FB45DRAFT_903303 [Roridomyces roridus]|uniref:Uncharacterized protein n=1 Tax=Roridomyces roridus TaxID=1738132 RepID=A0AAD7C472_9AGAR|nr:hypothetical protein FB45DRAFT_903303 [Roridomyces roridus]
MSPTPNHQDMTQDIVESSTNTVVSRQAIQPVEGNNRTKETHYQKHGRNLKVLWHNMQPALAARQETSIKHQVDVACHQDKDTTPIHQDALSTVHPTLSKDASERSRTPPHCRHKANFALLPSTPVHELTCIPTHFESTSSNPTPPLSTNKVDNNQSSTGQKPKPLHQIPSKGKPQKTNHTQPEDLFSSGVLAESSNTPAEPRLITRREIRELAHLVPKPKKKKAVKKGLYTQKQPEAAIPAPILRAHTSNQAITESPKAVRRPRTTSLSSTAEAPQAKRLRANSVRRPEPVNKLALIRWMNQLVVWEHVIFEGKQGAGDISKLVILLKDMVRADGVPSEWVAEKVRLRTVDQAEVYWDKLQLVQYIAEEYAELDGDGDLQRLNEELAEKWRGT